MVFVLVLRYISFEYIWAHMGVVRREGDWRLEKRDGGIYEITYDGATELKIVTSDYSPDIVDERVGVGVPVHEVNSFSEAETLFKKKAKSNSPSLFGDFGLSGGGASKTGSNNFGSEFDFGSDNGDRLEELEKLPPGGFALLLIGVGTYVVYSSEFAYRSTLFLFGVSMALAGFGILGWAGVVYKTQSARQAWEFLVTVRDEKEGSNGRTSSGESERTPPAPQSLKDDLYFKRASQKCEWCDERIDQPHVHHIEPRREGGPNTPSNLIVLCPGCHAKADRGAISKTKLRAKIRRQMKSSGT